MAKSKRSLSSRAASKQAYATVAQLEQLANIVSQYGAQLNVLTGAHNAKRDCSVHAGLSRGLSDTERATIAAALGYWEKLIMYMPPNVIASLSPQYFEKAPPMLAQEITHLIERVAPK